MAHLKIDIHQGNKLDQISIKQDKNLEAKNGFLSNEIIPEESQSLISNSICENLNNSLQKNLANEKLAEKSTRLNFSELEKRNLLNLVIEPEKLDKMDDSFDEINESDDKSKDEINDEINHEINDEINDEINHEINHKIDYEINDKIISPESKDTHVSILENLSDMECEKRQLPIPEQKTILDYGRFDISDENKEMIIFVIQNLKNFRESINRDYFKVNIYTFKK